MAELQRQLTAEAAGFALVALLLLQELAAQSNAVATQRVTGQRPGGPIILSVQRTMGWSFYVEASKNLATGSVIHVAYPIPEALELTVADGLI